MEFKKEITPASESINELLIYSKPKQGKTDLVSRIPDIGIIDIEGGSDNISGYKYIVKDYDPIKTLENLNKCLDWINKENPHRFYAFDTLTYLEDCCEVQGTYDYMNSPQGKSFNIIDKELIRKYPELKDDIKNLIGLCREHHEEFGQKKQFIKYLQNITNGR